MKIGSPEFKRWAHGMLPAFINEPSRLVDAMGNAASVVRLVFDLGRAYDRRITMADARKRKQ